MDEVKKNKRPKWVWIISAYYLLSCGYIILSFLLIHFKIVTLNEAQKAYFDGLSIFDYLISLGIGILGLTGAIFLCLMKKQSVTLFGAALALNIVSTVWHLFKTNLSEALGGSGLVGMFIGIGLVFGVFLYSRKLRSAGQLN